MQPKRNEYTITAQEAAYILRVAKWVMYDMGCRIEAGDAERYEIELMQNPTIETCTAWADYVLPPGKCGRVWLVLLSPPAARAKAFIAAILRAVR